MKPLKFAFAVSVYFEYGGMQRTMLRIAEECQRRGHDVHVYTGVWVGERPATIAIHEVNTRALTNVGKNDKLAVQLRHAVATCADYDCVAGFTKIHGLDVYYAGDPCYAARVDESKSRLYKWLPRYFGLRRQEAAVFSAGKDTEILLIAHQERDKFIRYYGTEPERFHLLPPGINRERFSGKRLDAQERQAFRRALGVGEHESMILTVGSRFKTKGLDRSLRALAALPDSLRSMSRLVVVGDDKRGPYERLAKQLGVADRLIFAGASQDVANFYHAADLLIHPPYTENTGTILIEAMLCGLPILVTGNCGFAFHVRDAKAGRVCPEPFEQVELNDILKEMLDSKQREEWRRNGPHYCDNIDLYSLIERSADIIIARAEKNRQHP